MAVWKGLQRLLGFVLGVPEMGKSLKVLGLRCHANREANLRQDTSGERHSFLN